MKKQFKNRKLELNKIQISRLSMKAIQGGRPNIGGQTGIASCTCPPTTIIEKVDDVVNIEN